MLRKSIPSVHNSQMRKTDVSAVTDNVFFLNLGSITFCKSNGDEGEKVEK